MSQKPIPPHLEFLLEAERARPDAPTEAKAAAQLRLAALLGPSSGLGGDLDGGSTGGGRSGTQAPSAAPSVAGGLKALTAAKIVGIFALGGLAGGGANAFFRPEAPVVYVDRPVPALAAVALPSASVSPALPLVPAPTPTLRASVALPAVSSSAGSRARDTNLAAERALLERARSALARGDGASALAAVEAHEHEFPRGQLVEEREVLAVQALVTAGRPAQAAERGARFRKAFPGSLLLPVVEQVLR